MCELQAINDLFSLNYKHLMNCCCHIVNNTLSEMFMSPCDLLHETYFELIRKKEKISTNFVSISYFYAFAKHLYQHKYKVSHIKLYDYITFDKTDDNGVNIEHLAEKEKDNEYLSDELNEAGKRVCEIVKGTIYEQIFNCIIEYDNIDDIVEKTGLKRKKVTTYMLHITELANYMLNNDNYKINTMSQFLVLKGWKKDEKIDCIKRIKTKKGDKLQQITFTITPEFRDIIERRSKQLNSSMSFVIVNDLENEYDNDDLYDIKSQTKRLPDGAKYNTLYPSFPKDLIDIVEKRARDLNNNKSRQIQFDLLHYYKRIGFINE